MPAAGDQLPIGGHQVDQPFRVTGSPEPINTPMQYQQWHESHDPVSPDRYAVYSDDGRVVCQTHGTWSRGPRDDEREAVVQLIAQAPDIRRALFDLEALVTAAISIGRWPKGTSPNAPPPQVLEARRILKHLRQFDQP